ncbi:MAG: tetratricopeptide repeat protein [Myxococcota bacterium]
MALILIGGFASACAWMPLDLRRSEEPLHISELGERGDAQRRASMRLVIDGLDADVESDPERALTHYERALQVDPTNPYAYIALARHLADGLEPERAIPFLDQAHALLRAQGASSPRADVALMGIRGQALVASGRYEEGLAWLDRAQARTPGPWNDGRLSAAELR